MRINHNIAALNTHRQLNAASAGQSKSMEKLSSGLRINRAGDDAAGLAISEKMRAQIRGLDQASSNAQDGISMIQTAEGALNETHSILQRMRELATQASNDTNTGSDRGEIQKEINQLTSEINRIGNTTEFNTQKILKGDGSAPVAQDALSLKKSGLVADPVSLAGGNIAEATSASVQVQFANDATGGTVIDEEATFTFNGQDVKVKYLEKNDNFEHGAMNVNDAGNEVTVYLKDGTKKDTIAMLTEQALNKAVEANSNIDAKDYTISRDGDSLNISTKGTGTGQSLEVTGAASNILAADTSKGSTDTLDTTATSTGANADRDYASGLVTFDLADITNQVKNSGIAESNEDYFVEDAGGDKFLSLDGLKSYLEGSGLTIGDETIEFYNGAKGDYKGTADFAVDLNDITWGVPGTDGEAIDDNLDALVAGIVEQIGDKMKNVELTDTTYVSSTGAHTAALTDQSLTVVSRTAGKDANSIQVTDGVARASTDVVGSKFEATFQIGANKGQSMTIEIGDMRADALNVTGKAAGSHTTVEGAKFTAVNNVTNGTDNKEATAALDVSSHESATAAIEVINNAIETVSAERSKLGAFQNRLEHTINNLGTSSENLTAAESRIRDVDMAKEMMSQTKNSILAQAAQAMLAQANQQPQGVLQLLR